MNSRTTMNKHFTGNTLRFLLLVVIAITAGCAQSTITDSSTSTPEAFRPKGRIIYSTTNGIFSFDIESKTTNSIFSTDKNQYYSFVVKNSIYVSMGDGISGDIFRMNIDGSNLEQLTFDGNNIFFRVSPNGDYLVYSHIPSQLFVYDIQTRKSRLVYEKNDFAFVVGSWSPDGKKFLFIQRSLSPEPSLYPISRVFLYSLEEKSAIEFLPGVIDFGFLSTPAWSPDGKSIALNMITESQSDVPGIYILNIETNSFQQVAIGTAANQFEWSLNGNMLVYEGVTEPIMLNVLDVTTKKTKIIYDGQTSWHSNFQLWSLDSKYIAYFTNIFDSPWYLNIQKIDNGESQIFEVPPGINNAIWIEK